MENVVSDPYRQKKLVKKKLWSFFHLDAYYRQKSLVGKISPSLLKTKPLHKAAHRESEDTLISCKSFHALAFVVSTHWDNYQVLKFIVGNNRMRLP